jgi:hypothetical protein
MTSTKWTISFGSSFQPLLILRFLFLETPLSPEEAKKRAQAHAALKGSIQPTPKWNVLGQIEGNEIAG